jgi:hypothetical protein
VIELPVTLEPPPTNAVLVTLSTFRPTAAPMLVSASRLIAAPSAFAVASTALWLETLTAPD